MQVDFYQLTRDPAETVIAVLAGKTLAAGQRLLVVSSDDALTARISERLWAADGFLAHGAAGGPDDARQPILLAENCEAGNAARFVILADGQWRDEALGFDRAFLLFDARTLDDARGTWRALDGREGIERRYFQQDEAGRWKQNS